jgi:hypothetical protein
LGYLEKKISENVYNLAKTLICTATNTKAATGTLNEKKTALKHDSLLTIY